MEKILFILLFINSFLSADYTWNVLNRDSSKEFTFCVTSYKTNFYGDLHEFWTVQCNGTSSYMPINDAYDITLIDNSNGNTLTYKNGIKIIDEIKKDENELGNENPDLNNNDNPDTNNNDNFDYTFDTSLSLTYDNLTLLGLSENDLNFSFAISGILMSFLFLYGIVVNI